MQNRKKLSASLPVLGAGSHSVGDFWQWAYSDILNNRNRSVFAEYLVGAALGEVDGVREEWDGYDLSYAGLRVEVKCSSYLQSWEQKAPSKPCFDIAHKRAWDAKLGVFMPEPVRYADIFVFCLFTALERASADVLDSAQWEFYILPTGLLNQHFAQAKSLNLASVRKHSEPVAYSSIKSVIDAIIAIKIHIAENVR